MNLPSIPDGKILISVVVPFRNAELHLDECINSLIAQTYPEDRYEIIMVDNNSTDRSAAIAGSYHRVKLLSESRLGAYAARNLAVRFAAGEIIAFTDATCVASSDWLERIAMAMQPPGIAMVQGHRGFANSSLGLSALSAYEREKAKFVYSGDDPRSYYACMANLATRKSVLEQLGLLLEISRGADVVFVQNVIDRFGCDAAQYISEIKVSDLEIHSISAWWQKLFVYGRSYSNYQKLVAVRPISFMERVEVYFRAARCVGFSLPRAAFFLPIMVVGAASYDLGRCLPLAPAS